MPRLQWCSGSVFVVGSSVEKQGFEDWVTKVFKNVQIITAYISIDTYLDRRFDRVGKR
jgi:hypothetical protein